MSELTQEQIDIINKLDRKFPGSNFFFDSDVNGYITRCLTQVSEVFTNEERFRRKIKTLLGEDYIVDLDYTRVILIKD